MFPTIMSNSISISDRATISCCPSLQAYNSSSPMVQNTKKKRNLPGNPDPDAEVIALSPRTLLATNRFVCEICNKGFQRDQNLQLHRRGHNLPWKLKQRNSNDNKKRAYVCPEPSCVHHQPSRALGDLTGIKKHYCRKHGEKKWKCDKCSKIYAVQSDWKAHSKICGAREHKCDCGTLFSRKDSFITHKAYCEAIAKENGRLTAATHSILPPNPNTITHPHPFNFTPQNPPPPPQPPSFHPFSSHNRHFTNPWDPQLQNPNPHPQNQVRVKHEDLQIPMMTSPLGNIQVSAAGLSASAAASAGPTMAHVDIDQWQKRDNLTRDFLGLAAGEQSSGEGSSRGNHERELLSYAGGVEYTQYDHDHELLLKNQGYEFAEACWKNWGDC